MIFENTFENLTKEQIDLLNTYFDGYDYQSSSHTYIANYIWRNTHQISWQIIGDYLCIGALGNLDPEEDSQYFMSFPLTNTGRYEIPKLRETLLAAKEIFTGNGQKLELSLVPESLVPLLTECFPEEGALFIEHDRDDDDYIYLKEDLVNLAGRKLHTKKNHLNQFMKNYEFTYEEVTPETVPEVMVYIESKNAYKLGETPEEWKEILELETEAIRELLKFVGKGLLTGMIRIHGKETVLVHVEKADDRIRGLYQAINHEFCLRLPEETVYVNREEDMGLANLRLAKMSYKPWKLAQKYTVIVK